MKYIIFPLSPCESGDNTDILGTTFLTKDFCRKLIQVQELVQDHKLNYSSIGCALDTYQEPENIIDLLLDSINFESDKKIIKYTVEGCEVFKNASSHVLIFKDAFLLTTTCFQTASSYEFQIPNELIFKTAGYAVESAA